MAQDKDTHPKRRVLLVRGGILSRYSGLGGAFHDLRTSLQEGQIRDWECAGTEEYNLPAGASGLRRIMKRWFGHPKQVAAKRSAACTIAGSARLDSCR